MAKKDYYEVLGVDKNATESPLYICVPALKQLFPLFFLAFFVVFFIILFRSLKQWNRNNHSPRLTVEATVVGRRGHRSGGGHDIS